MKSRTNTATWLENQSRWQIKVQKDGIRKTFTSATPGRTGQREANAKADSWLDDGVDGGTSRVDKLIDGYLEDIEARCSYSHYKAEEIRCRIWIKPEIGKLKISTVTEQHLQKIVNNAAKEGKAKKTLLGLRATLSAFFKYCRKLRVTTMRPEDISIPKSAPTKEKSILQPEHLKILFSSNKTHLDGKTIDDDFINAYRLQALTGLRPGELLGLEWGDIDDTFIKIKRSKNYYNEETQGKNRNAIRAIPQNDFTRNVLKEQSSISLSCRVFDNITTQDNYRKRWQKYCNANGIIKTTPYELRHTFVSIAKLLPEGHIKSIVGHSNNMDTFGVYGHMVKGESAEIAVGMETIFNKIFDNAKPNK